MQPPLELAATTPAGPVAASIGMETDEVPAPGAAGILSDPLYLLLWSAFSFEGFLEKAAPAGASAAPSASTEHAEAFIKELKDGARKDRKVFLPEEPKRKFDIQLTEEAMLALQHALKESADEAFHGVVENHGKLAEIEDAALRFVSFLRRLRSVWKVNLVHFSRADGYLPHHNLPPSETKPKKKRKRDPSEGSSPLSNESD